MTVSKKFNWTNLLFFTLTALASMILVPLYIAAHGLSWGLAAFFLVCFLISNLSVTCGYHRYFSHRSYQVHPVVEFLYILVGAGAFQGSILQWGTDHRRHHREVDTENDPYNIQQGFWHAHMGWMLVKDEHPEARRYAKDLLASRWIRWQHDYYPWIATAVGFGLPALAGELLGFGAWAGFLFGGVARVVVSQHSTFFINSLCHTLGRQPYTDQNSARDSFVMAILTLGEGYHNYHHRFQSDYRNGVRWYHFDPTKWWIGSLALLGLASRLKRVSREEIMKARLLMDERLLVARGASTDRVQLLKDRIMSAQAQMRELRNAYLEAKRESCREAKRRIRAEIKMAKIEFRNAYSQWRVLRSVTA